MSSDIAISVKNLTKTYRIFGHPGDRIKQAFTLGRLKFHKEFTALKDVSFEIKKGETVGIIGRNGSGKSTLLQLVCGILKPTSGSVNVNGRVSALLELGAGFNPEFTGRENIYFQGAIMGLTATQIDERFEDIATFADIGEFIEQPVRIYSSGMFVRLAFATAISFDPEILIVDEAIAVGDMNFQRKSFEVMSQMIKRNKTTVIIVSHDLRQIQRFCSKAIYLDNGLCKMNGGSYDVCQLYYEESSKLAIIKDRGEIGYEAKIIATDEVNLLSVRILNANCEEISEIRSGDYLRIKIRFRLNRFMKNLEFIIGTQASDFTYLSSSSTAEFATVSDFGAGEHEVEYIVDCFPLAPGEYYARFNVRDESFRLLFVGEQLQKFSVKADHNGATKPVRLLNLKTKWNLDGQSLN